jgi:hypothetical protein
LPSAVFCGWPSLFLDAVGGCSISVSLFKHCRKGSAGDETSTNKKSRERMNQSSSDEYFSALCTYGFNFLFTFKSHVQIHGLKEVEPNSTNVLC